MPGHQEGQGCLTSLLSREASLLSPGALRPSLLLLLLRMAPSWAQNACSSGKGEQMVAAGWLAEP